MTAATPRIGYYGDDFTGASDTLAVATRAGLRALLFLRTPTREALLAAGPLDVVGIAGIARSLPPQAMPDELLPAARLFRDLGVRVLHYKCCSTFDSSPVKGSLGAAVELLRPFVDDPCVAIVGGQPDLGRYCLFGNLFAAVEAGGAVFRLDRHPTMRMHPVTPMDEADLALHLAKQGLSHVASIPYTAYAWPSDALDVHLERQAMQSPDALLFDVARDADLAVVGRALWRQASAARMLAVGASGVVQSLAAHWGNGPYAGGPVAPAKGPVFVLSGSLSPVTARQVRAAGSYAHHALDTSRLAGMDPAYLQDVIGRVAAGLRAGRHVLATVGADRLPALPPDRVAAGCGALLAGVLERVPLQRIGVAGGDTSSHALRALDIEALSHAGDLGPGAALCRAHAPGSPRDGLEMVLKGGQMGSVDLFERLLSGAA